MFFIPEFPKSPLGDCSIPEQLTIPGAVDTAPYSANSPMQLTLPLHHCRAHLLALLQLFAFLRLCQKQDSSMSPPPLDLFWVFLSHLMLLHNSCSIASINLGYFQLCYSERKLKGGNCFHYSLKSNSQTLAFVYINSFINLSVIFRAGNIYTSTLRLHAILSLVRSI